ncbi:MAG: hypothetical protein MJ211_08150 [Bacteroidales bacterium]|nr:hypothetical protein [Bacteroidales bacterium]
MKKILFSVFILILLNSCSENKNNPNSNNTNNTVSTDNTTSINSNEIIDENIIKEIYNKISKEDWKGNPIIKKIDTLTYEREIETDTYSECDGANITYTEKLKLFPYKTGGYLVFMCIDGVCISHTYDYKNGQLSPSSIKLPQKKLKDFIHDYLFFLGADNKIDENNTNYNKLIFDNILYYSQGDNSGYEYEFDYGFHRLRFIWNGENFDEIEPEFFPTNYISYNGLSSHWTIKGINLGEPHPSYIKNYTIKQEGNQFEYSNNLGKRFSVVEDSNGNIEKITIYTSDIASDINSDEYNLVCNYDNSLEETEKEGRKVFINKDDQTENYIEYVFDKEGNYVEYINIVASK